MTAATIFKATQEIVAPFLSVWAGRPCDYPNLKNSGLPPKDPKVTWARFRIQHELFNQASLSNANGKRRFARDGFVFIQLFFPLGEGVEEAYSVAEQVVDAYQGKRTESDVWFRNVRVNEASSEIGSALNVNSDNWYMILVIAEFTYDQIK